MEKKIAIIIGTRPEIIKMSPIINYCEKNKDDFFVLHTGQHYSFNMDALFYNELRLKKPDFNLNLTSKSSLMQSDRTGRMLIGIERVLLKEKPDVVLVQGDTNTVLAGSLCTRKLYTSQVSISLGHVEAGLRSFDRRMPEEINRVVSDHLSDYLFAPTEKAKKNALNEGIPDENIYVTGNTIVEALQKNIKISKEKSKILEKLELKKKEFILITSHRPENVDNKSNFENILNGLDLIHKETGLEIIYPIHPRSKKMIEQFQLKKPVGVKIIEALGYFDFLQIQSNAKVVLTDSGGVQEESCILNVPCVTIRENTERPETIDVKSNIISGTNPKKILECTTEMINSKRKWNNPYGDGKTTEKIMKILSD